MKTDLFQSYGHCGVFQVCWHTECSTFTASSFRIWNSSAWIPPPPLALFIMLLSKVHLTSHYRMSGSRWVWMITPLWLSGSWRSFLYSSSAYSCHLFLISFASVISISFLSFIVPIFAWSVPLVSLIFLKRSLVFPFLFSSVAQLCPTLCIPIDCSTPGLPVHHEFLEFTQTHEHRVSDAIQPSHPLLSPSPPARNPSQHQGLFKWVRWPHFLCIRWPKYWSFSFNISPSNEYLDWFPLGWTGWISLQSKRLSRVFSNTQFKSIIIWHSASL